MTIHYQAAPTNDRYSWVVTRTARADGALGGSTITIGQFTGVTAYDDARISAAALNAEEATKARAKMAFNTLKAIGAPVLDRSKGWGGYFAISGECYGSNDGFYPGHIDHAPDGLPWADYYSQEWDRCEFGVHPCITQVLEAWGFYSEWVNAGVLAVYEG